MSGVPDSVANGGERRRHPMARRLYRYRPVPPVAFDDDGYPCEDGMGQDSDHIALFGYGLALKRHLAGRAAVHSDLSTHYAHGDRGAVIVPDLSVAFGGEERAYRRSYKLWEDPPPDFVLEVLSKKTWRQDVGIKKDTYAFLGVRECWLYDPKVRWLATPLEGYRLRGPGEREGPAPRKKRAYEPVEAFSEGRFASEALGLELHLRGLELRFFDPAADIYLRTLDEEAEAAAAAERRADEVERRARAEQQRVQARADAAEQRANAEEQRADAEKARAEAAERRAVEAERALAALRAGST